LETRGYPAASVSERFEDRATRILFHALSACSADLDTVRPGWRAERVGFVVGTSSGGMRQAERFFDGDTVDAESATYFGPTQAAARALGLRLDPYVLTLGACASSTIALGLASYYVDDGACDVCLAGGYDAVSVFVAAGFEVLRATSARVPPAPFRVGRDGMSLGEGAAIVALAKRAARARAWVSGFGATADAVHLTAPDRTGGGLARAIGAAMKEAGLPAVAIDIVSAHATATPFNDPAEARAMKATVAPSAVVHPFKAQIGHTLGAAGALEALACVDAMERGLLPAAAGEGALDPEAAVRLLDVAEPGAPRAALKLSAAFGGANAALVLTREPAAARPAPSGDAFVSRAFTVSREPDLESLAARAHTTADRLVRADGLVRLALAAIADLEAGHRGEVDLRGAGLVVGHAFATLETNARFQAGIREKGARLAEPRRFPYTSPNAVAGECSLAFGLTGPSFAVGGGVHGGVEALAVASLLVRAGAAERVVVVAVDEVGDAVRRLASMPPFGFEPEAGAVALLVSRAPAGAAARVVSATVCFDPAAGSAPGPFGPPGHLALGPLPRSVESRTGAARAAVVLEPL
jgi:3-oxoacyl-[acyl-carrier-protein] synthase-1/3-oxoacyl-[acyl-carrier-protein] synthase II